MSETRNRPDVVDWLRERAAGIHVHIERFHGAGIYPVAEEAGWVESASMYEAAADELERLRSEARPG